MISAQCLWVMDFQCTGKQLLLLSAEKPYALTAYIKKDRNNVVQDPFTERNEEKLENNHNPDF